MLKRDEPLSSYRTSFPIPSLRPGVLPSESLLVPGRSPSFALVRSGWNICPLFTMCELGTQVKQRGMRLTSLMEQTAAYCRNVPNWECELQSFNILPWGGPRTTYQHTVLYWKRALVHAYYFVFALSGIKSLGSSSYIGVFCQLLHINNKKVNKQAVIIVLLQKLHLDKVLYFSYWNNLAILVLKKQLKFRK